MEVRSREGGSGLGPGAGSMCATQPDHFSDDLKLGAAKLGAASMQVWHNASASVRVRVRVGVAVGVRVGVTF